MTPSEAEKLINEYFAAIGPEEKMARKKSLLPGSKARIKYAFYVYLEELIKKRSLNEKTRDGLVKNYTLLNTFIADALTENMHKSKTRKYSYIVQKVVLNLELRDEINEYIEECYKKYPDE